MAYTTGLVPAARLGVVHLAGTVEAADVAAAAAALYGDERWHASYGVLWDATGLAALVVGPDDVGPLGEALAAAADRGRPGRAAWVTADFVHGAIAQLLAVRLRGDGRTRRGFTSATAALRWLTGRRGGTPGRARCRAGSKSVRRHPVH